MYPFHVLRDFNFKTIPGALRCQWVNSLRPRRNERYNADDIFKWIFLKENVWIPTKISQKFVPKGPINNIPALVQIMAWRRPGDKPLSEPMMVSLLTHICVTRPQRVKEFRAWWWNCPMSCQIIRTTIWCNSSCGTLWVRIYCQHCHSNIIQPTNTYIAE